MPEWIVTVLLVLQLVEQELWQREEKGLIGILPVRDVVEIKPVGPTVSEGDKLDYFFVSSFRK